MKTVLVVDDDDVMRAVLRIVLEKAGYGVFEAENGLSGLEAANRDHPNLIVTDINMPVFDGLGLIAAVRGSEEIKSVPIIAISAEQNGAGQKALDIGASEFIPKPLSIGNFIYSIGKYFSN